MPSSFYICTDTEDHILPEGGQAFTLMNFSAGIFMCVPVYQENNTQESFVYCWHKKDKYSMGVGPPINLKKSHWQFYKKKIVSLVKRHQGIRKNIQGLKGFRKLSVVVVLNDSNFYSLVCTCNVSCCRLFFHHVMFYILTWN